MTFGILKRRPPALLMPASLMRPSLPARARSEVETRKGHGCQPQVDGRRVAQLTTTLMLMPAQRITTDRRMVAPWAGTYADVRGTHDTLLECFKEIGNREWSEWEAANPEPEAVKPDASDLEKRAVEHSHTIREITRGSMEARFTDYCSFDFVSPAMKVTGSFEDVSSSMVDGRLKDIYMMHRYFRDESQMNATVVSGRSGVHIIVEGTSPFWVESTANLLERNLLARRPKWASLTTVWGYMLSAFVFGGLTAAIVLRVANGLHKDPAWWGLLGVGYIGFLTIGNPKAMNWMLPMVDIHTPGSQPIGATHLKWVGGACAAAILGVIFDILLRG
jgi:hypothetical protein